MAISVRVRQELIEPANLGQTPSKTKQAFICNSTTKNQSNSTCEPSMKSPSSGSSPDIGQSPDASSLSCSPSPSRACAWTQAEHERFLEALEKYPRGPWKSIAEHVESKTVRQVMSHAQKYRQKIARRKRGLKTTRQRRKKDAPKTDRVSKPDQDKINGDMAPIEHDLLQKCNDQRPIVVCPPSPSDVSGVLNELEWSPVITSCAACGHLQQQLQPQIRLFQDALHPRVDQADMLQNLHHPIVANHDAGCVTEMLHPQTEDPQELLDSVFEYVDSFNMDDLVTHRADSVTLVHQDRELLSWYLFQ